MSFQPAVRANRLEYCPSSLDSPFCPRRNLLRPPSTAWSWTFFVFRKDSLQLLWKQDDGALADYWKEKNILSIEKFSAMGAAGWSADQSGFDVPARYFVEFLS